MEVPETSSLVHWTLENPWPVAVVVIAAGLIILSQALPRGSRGWIGGGLGAIGLAAALVVIASFAETGREAILRRNMALIDHAISGEVGPVADILSDSLMLTFGQDRLGLGKDEVLARVKVLPDLVTANNVWEIDAGTTSATEGESAFGQTTGTKAGQPLRNEWRVRWRREADGKWRAVELIWVRYNFKDVPSRAMLPGA